MRQITLRDLRGMIIYYTIVEVDRAGYPVRIVRTGHYTR